MREPSGGEPRFQQSNPERSLKPGALPGRGRGAKGAYAKFLAVGALLAVALLIRQLFDLASDGRLPALRQNDIYSAAGSVVMLAIIAYAYFGPVWKAKE